MNYNYHPLALRFKEQVRATTLPQPSESPKAFTDYTADITTTSSHTMKKSPPHTQQSQTQNQPHSHKPLTPSKDPTPLPTATRRVVIQAHSRNRSISGYQLYDLSSVHFHFEEDNSYIRVGSAPSSTTDCDHNPFLT